MFKENYFKLKNQIGRLSLSAVTFSLLFLLVAIPALGDQSGGDGTDDPECDNESISMVHYLFRFAGHDGDGTPNVGIPESVLKEGGDPNAQRSAIEYVVNIDRCVSAGLITAAAGANWTLVQAHANLLVHYVSENYKFTPLGWKKVQKKHLLGAVNTIGLGLAGIGSGYFLSNLGTHCGHKVSFLVPALNCDDCVDWVIYIQEGQCDFRPNRAGYELPETNDHETERVLVLRSDGTGKGHQRINPHAPGGHQAQWYLGRAVMHDENLLKSYCKAMTELEWERPIGEGDSIEMSWNWYHNDWQQCYAHYVALAE